MKVFLLILLAGLSVLKLQGQVSFSTVETKLKTAKAGAMTELSCTGSTMSVNFRLKRKVTIQQQKNFIAVDGQTVQVIALQCAGEKEIVSGKDGAQQLLQAYSRSEMDYFKNELGVELIQPNSQWVKLPSTNWLVWYFRVGKTNMQADNPTAIQLFASTIIGNKVLTINAPVLTDGDFNKAGSIVNDMMESMMVLKK